MTEEFEEHCKKNKYANNDIIIPNTVPDDNFIFIDENNLDKKICLDIINDFNKDFRKEKGMFGGPLSKIDITVKDTIELGFSSINEDIWIKYDKILYNLLKKSIVIYLNKVTKLNAHIPGVLFDDSGFQIQKYDKNKGKYIWHSDDNTKTLSNRMITFLWYLNDVTEGGETCFLNGKIIPTAGKLILFPATWTYIHKGNVPLSNDKYIITGWLSILN